MRALLVAGYLGIVVLCWTTPWGPRVFWTMVLPLLPIGIVLMGFHRWRRICPLAFWGEQGRTLRRAAGRRTTGWMESWYLLLSLGFLVAMLVMRLVATNGDGRWLGALLVGLALLAAGSNRLFSGKTWCNHLCPVGVVERIYTEPNSLPQSGANSQCTKCTACKKNCPDIDQENGYWYNLASPARRIATTAFPGVVLGFYTYYWLRAGNWEAYFDGRWTREPVTLAHVVGPGFFFAPAVPAVAAATLTLLGFGAASALLFAGGERLAARWQQDAERRRHLTLALAAFTAFNLFYLFAGAPSLRLVPGAVRTTALVVPVVATLFLVKRWRRRPSSYVQEKSARKLLASWPFKESPPSELGEVFAYFRGHQESRAVQLQAYRETLGDALASGLVSPRELHLLDSVRAHLDINEGEHRRVLQALSETQRGLLDPDRARSAERRLQLAGYQTALAAAVLRNAPRRELETIRTDYAIGAEEHAATLAELHGESTLLREKVAAELGRIATRRGELLVVAPLAATVGAAELLVYVLLKEQDRAVDRLLRLLGLRGDEVKVQRAAEGLFAEDKEVRRQALAALRAVAPVEVVETLSPIILERRPKPTAPAPPEVVAGTLRALAAREDPYLRAAAVLTMGELDATAFAGELAAGRDDGHELVREAARRAGTPGAALLVHRQPPLPERSGRHAAQPVAPPAGDFATLGTLGQMLFLRRVPLFVDLDPADLHDFCALAHEERITPPAVLCTQGALEDDLYVLVDGRAEVMVEEGGHRHLVAVLGPGEVVGELGALDHRPRSATVRPMGGPLTVLRIAGEDFRQRLASRPDLVPTVMAMLSRRLRESLRQSAG